MYVFHSFNKLYFNYNYKKLRKRQYDIVPRYYDDYNNYIKCLLNNKPDDENRKKDYNEYCSKCYLEYCPEHRSKYYKYKWD